MNICDSCTTYGLRFQRTYAPHEYIEGDPNAKVWIVGLNPAAATDWEDKRSKSDLQKYFDDPTKVHGYYRQFNVVSERLYQLLGKKEGAAHTDLVKCSSPSWPPKGASWIDRAEIIDNCSRHLQVQLDTYEPALIVCNGSEVSKRLLHLLPPTETTSPNATSYAHVRPNGKAVTVVLSGFIGRIDNHSKRRLGAEIETHLPRAHGDA